MLWRSGRYTQHKGAHFLVVRTRGAVVALAALSAPIFANTSASSAANELRDTVTSGVVVEDCPELPERCAAATAWVARVVRRAGYRVTGDTGSALIVTGQGTTSFYAWPNRTPARGDRERKRWRSCGVLTRTRLYCGRQRRSWLVHGWLFTVQAGPYQKSTLPRENGLARLIRASRTLQPPSTQRSG